MFRQRKNIVIEIFLIALLFTTANGQTVKVVSVTGKPIPEVVISGEDYSATTNKDGKFSLTPFLNDDSLKFSHVAFVSRKISLKSIMKRKEVTLRPKTFRTDVVTVSTEKINTDKEQITISSKEKAGFNNLAELLEKNSTINIKNYGGEGSLKTVSVRGMSSNNTLVLFNEAKVNDLRSGSFDFSLLGINSIDEVEIYKNGVDGFSAAGGVIKLTSGNILASNSILFGAKTNELLGETYYLKSGFKSKKNSLSVNIERSYSRNNYSYFYDKEIRERENADYSRFFASASFNKLFDSGFVKLYSHYSAMNNGLPGFVATNNYHSSHARSDSKNILTVGNVFYHLSSKINYKGSLSFNRQRFTISDPLNELFFFSKENRSTINEFQFNNTFSFKLNHIDVISGAHFLYGNMLLPNPDFNSEKYDYTALNTFGNIFVSASKRFTSLPLLNSFKPYASCSYSFSQEKFSENKTEYNYFAYKVGFIAVPEVTDNFTVELYYADNFREPNFTEIYYSRIFSSNRLKGEKYQTTGLTFNYSPNHNFSSSLSLYLINGKDKIVWLPTRLALQIPHNFRSIKSEGIEFFSKYYLFKKMLSLKLIYTYNSTTNTYFAGEGDEAYNKQLVYTPKNRLLFGATADINGYSAAVNLSYTDKSYYTSDNNPRFVLPAYILTDLSLSHSFNVSQYRSRITLNIYNLFNTDYFVIQSYPMPRRSFALDIQFGVF